MFGVFFVAIGRMSKEAALVQQRAHRAAVRPAALLPPLSLSPLTPVFTLPKSLFNLHLRLEGIKFWLGKVWFLSQVPPLSL